MAHGRKKTLSGRVAAAVDRLTATTPTGKTKRTRLVPTLVDPLGEIEEVYQALVLGVRDYVQKNGFRRVVVGLSGGVDSALTAVIAVDALGPENVLGVFMPSPYTSEASREDVAELVGRLRVELKFAEIEMLLEGRLRIGSKPEGAEATPGGIIFQKLETDVDGRRKLAAITRIVGQLHRAEVRRAHMGLAS